MPPQNINPAPLPAPKRVFEKILLAIAIIIALVAGYYYIEMYRLSKETAPAYVDTETGKPLSQEDIQQIVGKQQREATTHSFGGTISLKTGDILYVNDGNGTTAKIRIGAGTVLSFMSTQNMGKTVPIKYVEIQVGKYASVRFSDSVLVSALKGEAPLLAEEVIISEPASQPEG